MGACKSISLKEPKRISKPKGPQLKKIRAVEDADFSDSPTQALPHEAKVAAGSTNSLSNMSKSASEDSFPRSGGSGVGDCLPSTSKAQREVHAPPRLNGALREYSIQYNDIEYRVPELLDIGQSSIHKRRVAVSRVSFSERVISNSHQFKKASGRSSPKKFSIKLGTGKDRSERIA